MIRTSHSIEARGPRSITWVLAYPDKQAAQQIPDAVGGGMPVQKLDLFAPYAVAIREPEPDGYSVVPRIVGPIQGDVVLIQGKSPPLVLPVSVAGQLPG